MAEPLQNLTNFILKQFLCFSWSLFEIFVLPTAPSSLNNLKCVRRVTGLCIIHYSANDLNCSHTRWAIADPEHDRVSRKTSIFDGVLWCICLKVSPTNATVRISDRELNFGLVRPENDILKIVDLLYIIFYFPTSTEPRHDVDAWSARGFIRKWNETLKMRRVFLANARKLIHHLSDHSYSLRQYLVLDLSSTVWMILSHFHFIFNDGLLVAVWQLHNDISNCVLWFHWHRSNKNKFSSLPAALGHCYEVLLCMAKQRDWFILTAHDKGDYSWRSDRRMNDNCLHERMRKNDHRLSRSLENDIAQSH